MVERSSTECNSHETHNIYPNLNAIPLSATLLNDQQQLRLDKINEIKDYFLAEIKKRELMNKRLSKYIASFDYFDKSLIVTAGSISMASFYNCYWSTYRNSKCIF